MFQGQARQLCKLTVVGSIPISSKEANMGLTVLSGVIRKRRGYSPVIVNPPAVTVNNKVVVLHVPNPENFRIKRITEIGNYTIAFIRYPDCKNYEGNKILVFPGQKSLSLRRARYIDPHFTKSRLSPIARFEPTDMGCEMAISLAKALSRVKKK